MNAQIKILLFARMLFPVCTLSAQNFSIHFPDDLGLNTCVPFANWDKPLVVADSGIQINITYNFQTVDAVPDACYIYELDWLVSIGNATPATGPIVYVPNPTVSAIASNPLNFPGPVVSAAGTPPPNAPTLSKILPTDVIPTDFSTFWQGTDKVYKYTQHVRILDANRPVLLSGTTIIAPDSTGNDPDLWNEPYWNNPIDGSHDLQESSAELHLAVTDDCDASNLTLHYTVYSDFDYDGIAESANGPNQASAGQVWYNNLNGFNGELRYFDRTMPLDSFGLAKSVHGDTALFHIMLPPLPTGMHSVRWIVEDNCGNVTINTDTVNIQATTAAFEPGIGSLKVQPNPFSNKTRIYFHLAEAGVVYCSVFDVTGKLLSREADWFEGGDQIKSLGGNWPVGVYFYRLETRQGISSGKLLKKE